MTGRGGGALRAGPREARGGRARGPRDPGRITDGLSRSDERGSEGYRALREGGAYCWSVVIAAAPDAGRPLMERLMWNEDANVRWVMKQNLSKKRLAVGGADGVAEWQARLAGEVPSGSRERTRNDAK